ncbi:MAG: DivIVA domain-containing protein [Actinobacteria bacterium]|nr:DivIVA domain-containing protein [Actinomycetota bacterium]
MTLLLTLLVLAVAVAVAAVATGRITGGLDAPVSSLPARPLPDDGEIGPADVERVRFSPALRGYRMEEVDRTLDRLVLELARRDEVITGLRHRLGDPAPADQAGPAGPAGADPLDDPADPAASRPGHHAQEA